MYAVRIATVLLGCLGLALPSAPGIALCIGGDGDVELKRATHAVCAGTEPGGRGHGATACGFDRGFEAVDQSRDCHDVVLSRDVATSPPTSASEKHRPQQSLAEAAAGADCRDEHDAILVVGTRPTPTAHRVPTLRSLSTVVLRL